MLPPKLRKLAVNGNNLDLSEAKVGLTELKLIAAEMKRSSETSTLTIRVSTCKNQGIAAASSILGDRLTVIIDN